MTSASFLLVFLIASWLSPLPRGPGWEGKGRVHRWQGQLLGPHPGHAATEVIVKTPGLVLGRLLPSEASFRFTEVQWEPQILPHPFAVVLVLIPTNGITLGKSFPSSGSQFPY